MGHSQVKKKLTIYQIAEQAGVSITTVSRVLNGSSLVSDETRAAVQKVIDENHYSPSALARGLSSNKSKTIGVILPDITNPYFSSLYLEIQRYAIEQNYAVVLYNTLYGSFSSGIERTIPEAEYFQMMIDKRLDGVIVTGGQMDKEEISPEYLDALNRLQGEVPVVIIGQKFPGTKSVFIERALDKGVVTAIQHLHALGHKKIGFIGGELGVRITSDRFHAYKNMLEVMGLPFSQDYVNFSDYYVADGFTAMQRQLKQAMPTALLAINDMVALGAVRAANDAGLSVPNDIAIVSCDEFFFGEYATPRLTSLSQQNDYLGRLAIVKLMNVMNGMDDQTPIAHTPRLIVRESCGSYLGVRTFGG